MNGLKLLLPYVLLVAMCGMIWASFFFVAPAAGFQGDASRIVFYHVPTAWVASLAFLVSCVASVLYLRGRNEDNDARAAASAALGLLFAVLATVTGAIFAKVEWGAYWNWDPRQTSITLLLLIYAAYFALRGAINDPQRRAAMAAVYAVLAFVSVPFLMFVVPRIYFSLHPVVVMNRGEGGRLDSAHRQVLLVSVVLFTFLFIWLYNLEVRLARLRRRMQEEVL